MPCSGTKKKTSFDKARLIEGLRRNHLLSTLLDIARIPRSVFYYHRAKLSNEDKYADLKQSIEKLYHQHKGRYGYRRITAALKQLGSHHNHT